jgi:hypothetical protein
VLGLAGRVVRPLGKGKGVLLVEDGGDRRSWMLGYRLHRYSAGSTLASPGATSPRSTSSSFGHPSCSTNVRV